MSTRVSGGECDLKEIKMNRDSRDVEFNENQSQNDEIAIEAYVYFYPLILMDVTRKVMTNFPLQVRPGMGPANVFSHMRAFPPAEFRDVVRPNFDTLYSSAWVDLTREPIIVSAPNTEGRYYLLPMLDMWTDVFAAPGKRTSGTQAGNWALVPPRWTGRLPANVERIDAPTAYVWLIGRTQTNGPKDYDAVHKVQEGYVLTPLSRWGKGSEPVNYVADPTVEMKTDPMSQVNTMPAAKYFARAAELMKVNPPHITDWSQIARLKRLGIEPGRSFNWAEAPAEIKSALEKAPGSGLERMRSKVPTLARVTNGWQMNTDSMGVYGNNYLKRAIVALMGLGANQTEDAIYPLNIADADGNPMVGDNKYVMHFSKEELPPVNAFWSVTMYDAEGFTAPNKLNRLAIGDRDALKYNADGSLDIYIQAESPGIDKESNWLPAPAKKGLGVTMRLYAPKAEILDGRWNPPAVKKVN